jgi:hypothetical protein
MVYSRLKIGAEQKNDLRRSLLRFRPCFSSSLKRNLPAPMSGPLLGRMNTPTRTRATDIRMICEVGSAPISFRVIQVFPSAHASASANENSAALILMGKVQWASGPLFPKRNTGFQDFKRYWLGLNDLGEGLMLASISASNIQVLLPTSWSAHSRA